MKMRFKWISLFLSTAILIEGCSIDQINYVNYKTQTKSVKEAHRKSSIQQDNRIVISNESLYYAYSELDAEHKIVYEEIFDAIRKLKEEISVSTVDEKVLDEAFMCVMNDHPEIFFVDGYRYTEQIYGSDVVNIVFKCSYTMDRETIIKRKEYINERVSECLSQLPSGDDYVKVKYIYEWLIKNTEYDVNVQDNQNICSVFLYGKSVCNGYAKAFQYLLQKSGIQSFLITGYTKNERHAWTMVKVNGSYYYVDPTWGDASYTYRVEQDCDIVFPEVNYEYFLVTSDEILRTHRFEEVIDLPVCVTTSDNYYVREGLLLSGYNEEYLRKIFYSAEAKESGYVTVKCTGDDSYEEVMLNLIEWNKVFDMVENCRGKLSCTSNKQQRTISFWGIY